MAKDGAKPGVARGSNGRTLAERFWPKVSIDPDGCWLWTAAHRKTGYGQLRFHGKLLTASRVAWELANGPIPVGLDVLHRCDNPPCVRFDHLFLGDARANALDMVAKGRGVWSVPPQPTTEQRARGERHGMHKLTEENVRAIRSRYAAGDESQYALAAAFGVTRPMIGYIVRRKNWAHVDID